MKKFDSIMNAITDNIVLFLILFVIFSWLLKCSSTTKADTVRLQERSEATIEQLDKAIEECGTDDCRTAMKRAKELIKDSMDTLTDKDADIADIQEQIKEDEIYADIGQFVVWGVIALFVGLVLWTFRNQIIALIKLVKPF